MKAGCRVRLTESQLRSDLDFVKVLYLTEEILNLPQLVDTVSPVHKVEAG
jgi:hypothetical protein